jgi:transposase InsO family protein
MFAKFGNLLKQAIQASVQLLRHTISVRTKPMRTSLMLGCLGDLVRSKPELIAENALLRQHLIVLSRSHKRPRFTNTDRTLLVLLARRVRGWKQAVVIVKPDTLLRWHRQGFRLCWRRTSRAGSRAPRIPVETVALIKELGVNNRLWGVKRIQGELRKLGITVSKRTIQRYLRQARPPQPSNQTWATFLRNHASDIWACDFLHITDIFFQPVFAFFITELGSRRIVHMGVTRAPTDMWTAQQLREATPFGIAPEYLIRDNDAKYGAHFAAVAAGAGIEVLRTPIRAPRANAICERVLGSVRRECLDHILVINVAHLRRVLNEYVRFFNRVRPHQGIKQRVPVATAAAGSAPHTTGRVISVPVLGGLHHEYQRVA